MKIEDIAAFVSVVRARSLSQAAKDMGLTQPAITRRIQNLEESLGIELLDRATKPPKPNAAGQKVYEQCRAVLDQIERLRELAAADAHPSGSLRLGLTQGIGDLVLQGTLDGLTTHYPDLQPSIVTGWGQQLLEQIHTGELDAAATWLPVNAVLPKNATGQALGRTDLVVVAPAKEVTRRAYRLVDWHTRGWVLNPDGCGFRAGLRRALTALGLPLTVRLDTNSRELQLELVADGHGLGLVPLPLLERSARRQDLGVVPLTDFKPQIELWLLHRPALGRLQEPVDQFGTFVAQVLQGA
ncbi:LysR family transcriptional regulator [Paucibacter sp. R3-3]|uniref:LysR family transcriptional regulator n=1 Tax=Roseateles agri TaxID=3098619 RepID=A0ABU5DR46_9BURK|nr:LysR family transcriptional regulator [Paucibacter sp. R3-3]MDY0747734.1 LysR family transcriptional regulator [Paucibacter sp. R3-3]